MANNDLFSSLISDIKTYSGKDPLLPWLRGIRKMKDSLPSHILNEKLPRFLQKCAEKFESDRRYRNDLRYLRVWLQLMDYVDDPRALLKTMEEKSIGTKCSLFYQAYALYYEKLKKFDDAERMYHLGAQKLAEPADELERSYEQFLHRMKRHNYKRIQLQQGRMLRNPSGKSISTDCGDTEENNSKICSVKLANKGILQEESMAGTSINGRNETEKKLQETADPRMFKSDDTVIVKFVDTTILGKSVAENACHHGLVEPTVNMKEAMNAINSMFSQPLEMASVARQSRRSHLTKYRNPNDGFEVFIDENFDKKTELEEKQEKEFRMLQHGMNGPCQPEQQALEIFVDDEADGEIDNDTAGELKDVTGSLNTSASRGDAFFFPFVKNLPSENSDDHTVQDSVQAKFREDTVVCRFVGTAITNEPKVENICHHGLVEPTVNMKEAMDDINSMFGKPMEFVRTRRSKKQEKPLPPEGQNDFGGFSILPDDDLEPAQVQPRVNSLVESRDRDLFEPTVITKEAMDDINQMFSMPLDF